MSPAEIQKIGIIGAGAMGLTFAARFLTAGFDVCVYEHDPVVRQALQDGFILVSESGATHHIATLVDDPATLSDAAQVFVFVKSYATADVAALLSSVLTSRTIVVTLQNGLGNDETLRARGLTVVAGTTAVGSTRLDYARVRLAGMGLTVVGGESPASQEEVATHFVEMVSEQQNREGSVPVIDSVVRTLTRAGFPVKQVADVKQAIWQKAIINAAINPLASMLNVTNGELLTLPGIRNLQWAIIAEALSVATTQGISLSETALRADVENVCRSTATNICSMLQDLRAHRATEILSINGSLVSLGENAGLALPVNDTLCRLILART